MEWQGKTISGIFQRGHLEIILLLGLGLNDKLSLSQ